ncbi:MAG: TlpA family protein disulfide reductase [Candidatus Hydrogenedentes bacterium]|nr:TlpA family protein disulfide reductase [Candidatus Hydrogenedentota bacterium]
MKRILSYALVAVVAVLIAQHSVAKPVGPAKPLHVAQWVKNGPINLADGAGKNVYLVEFWASWCPPCRESVAHLTALQKKYKDKGLVVVGVSAEETDDVKAFVSAQGDRMNYAVAVDQDGKTNEEYMDANGINTIPHAFLVDKSGAVAWHGFPLDNEMEKTLVKLLGEKPVAPR